MSDDEREKYPSEEAERFQVRMPPGLRERIKQAAERNNRSMNSEIVATLEEKYPPPSIDLKLVATFLETLVMPFADEDGREEYDRYVEDLNDIFSKMGARWTVKSDPLGPVAFYPYASPKTPPDKPDDK